MRPTGSALLHAGIVVAAAGFALMTFTWGRVASLESVALQLPYLVSGGLAGLGLVIVGAVTVNIYAKRREGADRERQTQQLLEILRQLTVAVSGAPPELADAAAEGDQASSMQERTRGRTKVGLGGSSEPTPAGDLDANGTEDLPWQP